MAKRFTDSDKFRDTWYRKLKPKHKCLWEYFLAECSVAGTLEIDLDSISFHIGDIITDGDLAIFKDRIHFIEKNVIFIPKFLKFQQPNGLSRSNKAHNNIFKMLEKYNIPETLEIKGNLSLFEAPLKELPSSPSKSKGNSKGNSNIISNIEFKEISDFETLWNYWCENKTGTKFKNEKTSEIAFNKLLNLSNNNFATAKAIVEQSISGPYQGLFALKGNSNSSTGRRLTDREEQIKEVLQDD